VQLTLISDPCILGFSDVQAAFTGRGVLAKHKAYSLYRPSAVLIAQTLVDLPIFFVQIVIFTIIVYFMVGLQSDAGLYFAFLLFIFAIYGTFTCLCRAIGYAFSVYNDATKVSGLAFTAFTMVSTISKYSADIPVLWVRDLHTLDAPMVLLDPMDKPDLLHL
jgi:ABC-type multidrug transport system permease subunit